MRESTVWLSTKIINLFKYLALTHPCFYLFFFGDQVINRLKTFSEVTVTDRLLLCSLNAFLFIHVFYSFFLMICFTQISKAKTEKSLIFWIFRFGPFRLCRKFPGKFKKIKNINNTCRNTWQHCSI